MECDVAFASRWVCLDKARYSRTSALSVTAFLRGDMVENQPSRLQTNFVDRWVFPYAFCVTLCLAGCNIWLSDAPVTLDSCDT